MPVHGQRERGTGLVANQDSHDGFLDSWRDQVEQSLGQQGVGQESAPAYVDFLDSLFYYYGESMRAVEKGTKEG
jgi:hypothetical protein